jgi:hypothetical protein
LEFLRQRLRRAGVSFDGLGLGGMALVDLLRLILARLSVGRYDRPVVVLSERRARAERGASKHQRGYREPSNGPAEKWRL